MDSIRMITWTVSDDGLSLSPATPQLGGVQGEDNAAAVFFNIGKSCLLAKGGYKLYIEVVDAAGNWDRTDLLLLDDGYVSHPVPLAWTQNGGTITVRLVAESGEQVVYTLEGQLYFENRQTASTAAQGLFRSEVQKALAEIREAQRKITAMAAAGGFLESYSDHLKEIRTGKDVHLWIGTEEEFKEWVDYLPGNTMVYTTDDPTLEELLDAIGARAPGGYGLGAASKKTDPDTVYEPGFYYFDNVTVDGHSFGYAYMQVAAYSAGSQHVHQTMYTVGEVSYTLHRNRYKSEWQPWEWENPPMQDDVEYMTTERHLGKPVYAKRFKIDISSLDSGKGNLGIGEQQLIMRATAYTGDRMLPRTTVAGSYQQTIDITRNGAFTYVAGANVTDKTLYIQCYYYNKEG